MSCQNAGLRLLWKIVWSAASITRQAMIAGSGTIGSSSGTSSRSPTMMTRIVRSVLVALSMGVRSGPGRRGGGRPGGGGGDRGLAEALHEDVHVERAGALEAERHRDEDPAAGVELQVHQLQVRAARVLQRGHGVRRHRDGDWSRRAGSLAHEH